MDPVIQEAFQARLAASSLYYVWVFDPQSGQVELVDPDEDPLGIPSHDQFQQKYPHPETQHGYAYRIVNGWRITDWEHKQVDDQYVLRQVQAALQGIAP